MYKLYVKSAIEVWPTTTKVEDMELIADLILLDIEKKVYFMIRNEKNSLSSSKRLIHPISTYIRVSLNEAFEINELNFNYLLNHIMADFYLIKKHELLKKLNLEEQMI